MQEISKLMDRYRVPYEDGINIFCDLVWSTCKICKISKETYMILLTEMYVNYCENLNQENGE